MKSCEIRCFGQNLTIVIYRGDTGIEKVHNNRNFILMIVSGGLLLISQRSNDSIENCMIEDYSNFDISVSESENTLDSSLKTTDEEKAAIQSECIVISELYREIYQQAPKVPSQYFGAENDITQETIDEIENILIAAGYSVINSDSIYPEYLEHSDCVNAFGNV